MVRIKLLGGGVWHEADFCFHPTMVRIKLYEGKLFMWFLLLFPSHNGSDQTHHRRSSVWLESSFHPTMVRIKLWDWAVHGAWVRFHPTMVRIKPNGGSFYSSVIVCFHPTMVRIKHRLVRSGSTATKFPSHNGSDQTFRKFVIVIVIQFPSPNGSDQTLSRWGLYLSWWFVSIPQWFGSNLGDCTVYNPHLSFPSHNGSDQTKKENLAPWAEKKFPSHNGSDQTLGNTLEWKGHKWFPSHNGSDQTSNKLPPFGCRPSFPSHNGSDQTRWMCPAI